MATSRKKEIFSEIRLLHDTVEERDKFNEALDKAVLKEGYKYKRDWLRHEANKLIKKHSKP